MIKKRLRLTQTYLPYNSFRFKHSMAIVSLQFTRKNPTSKVCTLVLVVISNTVVQLTKRIKLNFKSGALQSSGCAEIISLIFILHLKTLSLYICIYLKVEINTRTYEIYYSIQNNIITENRRVNFLFKRSQRNKIENCKISPG